MKPNIITDGLPKKVVIDGREYSINWDFRVGMKFDEIMESELPDAIKLEKLLILYFPKIPDNLEEAVKKILWFYRGGKAKKKEEKKERYKRRSNRGPAFSFSQDAPYIYAAFKEQYGIDLLSQEKLHWWKFLALFESLGEETKMAKIMNNVERQKSFYKRNEESVQAGRWKETHTGRTQPTMEGVCKKEKSRKDGEVTWQQMDQLRSAPS